MKPGSAAEASSVSSTLWKAIGGLVIPLTLVLWAVGNVHKDTQEMLSILKVKVGGIASSQQLGLEQCFKFPEKDIFQIRPGRLSQCRSPQFVVARNLQSALRACLAAPACTALEWEREAQNATLCEAAGMPEVPGGTCKAVLNEAVVSAYKKPGLGAGRLPCPGGQVKLENGQCDVCNNAICGALPGAQLAPGYDDATIQAEVARLMDVKGYAIRAFNPSLAAYQGRTYLVARVSNATHQCETNVTLDRSRGAFGLYHTRSMLCPLGEDFRPQPKSCFLMPWDTSHIRRPSDAFVFAARCTGLEDARSFVWRDRLQMIGTVNKAVDRINKDGCHGKIVGRIGIVKLNTSTLDRIDDGVVASCDGIAGRQKNWMPLVINDTLYLVMHSSPLVVGVIDERYGCALIQRETVEPQGLQAILPEGKRLRGSTPFVPIGGDRYVALTHHSIHGHPLPGYPTYSHHFVIMSARPVPGGGHPIFALDWVSEAFRFPDVPGQAGYVQFSAGLLLKNDTLYVSYGASDCFTAVAVVPDFAANLRLWEEFGMGTQNLTADAFAAPGPAGAQPQPAAAARKVA